MIKKLIAYVSLIMIGATSVHADYWENSQPVTSPSNVYVQNYGACVSLTWNDNSRNEEGFEIWKKSGARWKILTDEVSPNITSYTDCDVRDGKKYSYRIRAYGDRYSKFSNTATIVKQGNSSTYDPYSYSASANNGSIKLSWQLSNNADNIEIYRYDTYNGWTTVSKSVPGYYREWTDYNVTSGRSYYYSIRTKYGYSYGNWIYSNWATPYGDNNNYYVSKPYSLYVGSEDIDGYNAKRVTLSWNSDGYNTDGYYYEFRETGNYNWASSWVGSSKYATIGGLKPNTSYQFRVKAYRNSDYSYSDIITYTTTAGQRQDTISTPYNVYLSDTSQSSLAVRWDYAGSADKFEIYYRTEYGSYMYYGSSYGSSYYYTLSNLSSNTKYYIKIRAVYGSQYSNFIETSGYTLREETSPLSAPYSIQWSSTNPNTINVSWGHNGDADYYEVYYRNQGSDYYSYAGKVSRGTYSYTLSGLSSNSTYYVKVRAVKGSQYSNFIETTAKTANYTTTLPTITNLGAEKISVGNSTADFYLTWSWDGSRADKFVVQRSTSNNNWSDIYTYTNPGSQTSLKVRITQNTNETNYYRVIAYRDGFYTTSNTATVRYDSSTSTTKPNLYIQNVIRSSQKVQYNICNNGGYVSFSNNPSISVQLGNYSTTFTFGGDLKNGECTTLTTNLNGGNSYDYARVMVDSTNIINESNENDNTYTIYGN